MIEFEQAVSEIKDLCAAGKSGTVFLVNRRNQSAHVVIKAGEIVGVMCHGKRGWKAVELMHEIVAVKFSFKEGLMMPVIATDLPSTSELLAHLDGSSS